jgi:hypothetical protein
MRTIEEVKHNKAIMVKETWTGGFAGFINLSTGIRASVVAGWNEGGWEHVSIRLYARRLPKWEEMCEVKEIFWDDEEEVAQFHPRKSKYVNITEALHLWRPVDGDWSIINKELDEND